MNIPISIYLLITMRFLSISFSTFAMTYNVYDDLDCFVWNCFEIKVNSIAINGIKEIMCVYEFEDI